MRSKVRKIIVICAIGMFPFNALARAPLEATTPIDGATINQVPTEVSMTFYKSIHLTQVTSTHDGKHAADLRLKTQARFGTEFQVALEAMGAGIYAIKWRGLGEDGNFYSGSFSFTVK